MSKAKKESIIAQALALITPESERLVAKNVSIVQQVRALMQRHGLTQLDLARRMGKQPSEVSRWLSGMHNLTIESIVKMEVALDADIIMTPLMQGGQQYKTSSTAWYAERNEKPLRQPDERRLRPMVPLEEPTPELIA